MAVGAGPRADAAVVWGQCRAPVVVAVPDGLSAGAAGVLDEHVETGAQLAGAVAGEVDLVSVATEGEDDAFGGGAGAAKSFVATIPVQ